MHWLEISLNADREQASLIEDALLEVGAQAVTLSESDTSDEPVLEPGPGETPLWRKLRLTGLFTPDLDARQVAAALERHLGQRPDCRLVEDRDWVRAWLDHYQPMRFGRRLWICPRGQSAPTQEHGDDPVVVELDPGLAFGTGTHPSTALCLEWLDGACLGGATVMDYGCGSGILGIAAARLGATQVHGVDIDAQALRATRENAEQNGVAACLTIHGADRAPKIAADILLANILAAPLIALASTLAQRVASGGHIVLSGILERQAGAVAEAYRPWFRMAPAVLREGWARLEGRRIG